MSHSLHMTDLTLSKARKSSSLGGMTTMFPEAAPYPPPAAGHWVQMILPWARVMTQCHQPGPLSIQRAGWREACNLKVNQPNQQNTQIKIPG